MQFHTEFQYDPAQDRRAGRTGQQRLELEVCASGSLAETGTTVPARREGAVVQGSAPGGARQPSYTVRTVRTQNTDFGVTISKFLWYKLVLIHIL
eukprot:COSAG02_NODE_552_length_20429_cov_28.014068_7_plen_95_part_00